MSLPTQEAHDHRAIHICTTTADQRPYEEPLRAWLQEHGYTVLSTFDAPLVEKLSAAQTCDICLLLLGTTFGPCEPLSWFSHTELEASAAVDNHPGRLLVFEQRQERDFSISPEQREFIDRLRNFWGGTFQAKFVTYRDLEKRVEDALRRWQPPPPQEEHPRPSRVLPNSLMISSTRTLLPERDVIRAVLKGRNIPCIDYLRAPAEAVPSIDRVISWARECHALLLILADTYGYISPVDGLGATELEFVTALQAKRPILAFIREDAPNPIIPPLINEDQDQRQFVERVLHFVPSEHIFYFQKSEEGLEQLKRHIWLGLELLNENQELSWHPEVSPETTRRWHRRQVQRWLGRLPHLTQPKGMPLEQVYVSLYTLPQQQQSSPETSDPRRVFAYQKYSGNTPQPIQVDDALHRYPRFVLRGDPGAGKSVTLRWYALHAPRIVTPILIKLSRYARMLQEQQVSSLLDFILVEERRLALLPTGVSSAWQIALEQGQGLLLLDALDEVPSHLQETVTVHIQHLARLLPMETRIVVTTRIVGFINQLGAEFTITEVQPLNDLQQQRLAEQWLRAAHDSSPGKQAIAQARAQKLIDLLKRESQLAEWARTPLMMTFLVALSDTDEEIGVTLPTTKAMLYQRVLRLVLGQWGTLSQRRGGRHLWLKERIALELARQGVLEGRGELLGMEDMEQVWVANRHLWLAHLSDNMNPVSLLREMNEEDGLLIRLGEGQFTFLHGTIQDYLSATLLTQIPQQTRVEQVARKRLDVRWEQVTQFVVSELDRRGQHKEADELVWTLIRADTQPVAPFHWRDPLRLALLRAARCQGGRERGYAVGGPGPYLAEVWWNLWHDGVTDYRLYCVVPLAEQAFAALGPAGISILERLSELRRARYIPQKYELNPRFTLFASAAFGSAATLIVEELHQELHTSDTRKRANTLAALGYLGRAAIPALGDLCEALNDTDENCARDAAASLIQLRFVLSPVMDCLRQGIRTFGENGRYLVTWVLSNMLTDAAPAIEELRQALHDPSKKVREGAACALAVLGPAGAPAARDLWQFLQDKHFHDSFIISRLGEGVLPLLEDLAQALQGPNPKVREDIFYIFEQLRPFRLFDLDSKVREDIFILLEQLGPFKARIFNTLREALHDNDANIRRRAATILQIFGPASEPVLKDLQQILREDPVASVRLAVLDAMGGVGPAALPVLEDIFRAIRDAETQQAAILAIGALGPLTGAIGLETLRQLLHVPDAKTRATAAKALGKVGQTAAQILDDLCQAAIHDSDEEVREQAVRVIGRLGSLAKPALDDLRQALQDSNERVRSLAQQVLEYLRLAARAPLEERLLPVGALRQALCEPDTTKATWVQGTIGYNSPLGQPKVWSFRPPYDRNVPPRFMAILETIEDAGWESSNQPDGQHFHTQEYRRVPSCLSYLADRWDW